MCTRRLLGLASAVLCIALLSACSSPERTGSAFCAQLGKELPAIATPLATTADVTAMIDRYERLLERAPLTIEKDLQTLTDVLKQAEKLNANDKTQVQELADATYRANQASLSVRDWVKSTCAVDISTGVTIEPMRQATTTTVETPTATAETTIAPPPETTIAPETTAPVATPATTVAPTATTVAPAG